LPGREEDLEKILRETAEYSLAEEPLCLRFEVMRWTDDDGNVLPVLLMINELFEGFEGVEAHRSSPRTPPRIAAI